MRPRFFPLATRALTALTALATLTTLAAPAHAREVSAVAAVELGFGFGKSATLGSVTGLTPRLSFFVPFEPGSGLVLEWGLTTALGEAAAPLASSGIALQNPFLGFRFALEDRMWFTPGVTIPVATITTDPHERPAETVASNMGRSTYGVRELWRYIPDNLSIVAPIHGTLPLDEEMAFVYDAALALAIPTAEADPDLDLIVDLGVAWVYDFLSLGIGLAWIPTNSGDNTHWSLRTGVHVPVGDGVFYGDMTLNLGGQFDSFGDAGVIGADLGVRFHF
jgi:hypothetical protein